MFETLSEHKRLSLAATALAGSLVLTGCTTGPENYSGQGNEFVVQGTVSDSEIDGLVQLEHDSLVIIDSDGEAASWFTEGRSHGRFTDEYDFVQRFNDDQGPVFLGCGTEVVVGTVLNTEGDEIEPEDLQPGDAVQIEGSIRDSEYRLIPGKTFCSDEQLAVYETVQVID